ncbi:MAG: hypothetical protein IH628_00990 [Proteobacteria bacterium]|nr:hypothetical protein [Pseudomonadota bacterium]
MRDSIPASETETFEEVAQTMDASAPVVDQVPEDLESPASSAEETEMHVAEEGILDDGVSDSFGQPLLVEPDDGGEAPAQADTELGETEEKLSENAPDEDAFGLGRIGQRAPSPEAATTLDEDTPAASVEAMSDESNSFGDPGPAAVESGAPASSENVGGTGEGYEEFDEAMRRELSGSENTVSLEEFLAPADQSTAEYDADDGIEELAEKLKTPPKITPVIDITEKKAPPPSEEDTPASTGFVTPTLAEIYAKQGWYDDAIVAYKTLARIKPAERERFEKRIQELEELKKSEEGGA